MQDYSQKKSAKILSPSADLHFCIRGKIPVIFLEVFPWGALIPSQDYADSRFRPFALLLLITACPDLVFMRARNPWLRLRLVLLG